jgi:hypothetical protein
VYDGSIFCRTSSTARVPIHSRPNLAREVRSRRDCAIGELEALTTADVGKKFVRVREATAKSGKLCTVPLSKAGVAFFSQLVTVPMRTCSKGYHGSL